jgi:hypothetical protein
MYVTHQAHIINTKTPYSHSTGQRLNRGIAVKFPTGPEFSLLYSVHTGYVAHPASYPMDTGKLSLEVKWSGREADLSTPRSAEIKTVWSRTSTPNTPSWRDA